MEIFLQHLLFIHPVDHLQIGVIGILFQPLIPDCGLFNLFLLIRYHFMHIQLLSELLVPFTVDLLEIELIANQHVLFNVLIGLGCIVFVYGHHSVSSLPYRLGGYLGGRS